jgi:CO/xanthine dehydrogenase Mo-binding subunit
MRQLRQGNRRGSRSGRRSASRQRRKKRKRRKGSFGTWAPADQRSTAMKRLRDALDTHTTWDFIRTTRCAPPVILKVVRSPYAHAELLGIDDSRARNLEGLVGRCSRPQHQEVSKRDRHPMNRIARHPDDAAAAVMAQSQYAAQEALNALRIDWEPLPVRMDAEIHLARNDTSIHEGGPVAGMAEPSRATCRRSSGRYRSGFP